jgi:hypothetical protein
MNPAHYRINILIPAMDRVHTLFASVLANLVNLTRAAMPDDGGVGVQFAVGTYLHKSREDLLEFAIEGHSTHVLWLDGDMRFPPDALIRLLQNNVPIVGINYSKRRLPPGFVGIKTLLDEEGNGGERLRTDWETTGMEQCEALGFGCVLMQTAALANVERPWFDFGKGPQGQMIGEDVYFFSKLKDEKIRVFVDHDLSLQCSHMGDWEFKIDGVLATEEAALEAMAAMEEEDGAGN